MLAYHCAFVLGGLDGDGLGRWLAELNVGVVLFFAISGFLLYRPFVVARLEGVPPPGIRAYAVRRGLRIVPAYWVALTLIGLATARWSVFSPGGVVTYYGFLQSYRADTIVGGIGQAWTLGVEIAFYALLPVIAWLATRGRSPSMNVLRREVVLLSACFGLSVAWKVAVIQAVSPRDDRFLPLLVALPAQLDHFVLGMALAVASVWLAGRAAPGPRAARLVERFPGGPWAVAGTAFALLGTGWHVGGESGRILGEHALQGVVALGLLLPAVVGADGGGRVRRLLARPELAWVGMISYGVYLWHLDILRELARIPMGGWALVPAGTILSLTAGALSWYGVERRALGLGRRLSGRRRPTV